MNWAFADSHGGAVRRVNADGSYESRLVTDKDVAAWIKLGNKPDPYEPPPQQPQLAVVLFFGPKKRPDSDADQAKLGTIENM